MPRSAASLIPDHDDSVENEKDFGPPPPKKLKGEEDNSSVPMSKDSDREAFKRWCQLFREEGYPDKIEEEKRFKYFKDSLDRQVNNPLMLYYGMNAPQFADRNEQEFNDMAGGALYCSISTELLDELQEFDSEVKASLGNESFSGCSS